MQALLATLEVVVLIGAAGCAAYWSVVAWRVRSEMRAVPRLEEGLQEGLEAGLDEGDDAPPSVCVVVPAHNERDSIGALIRSLRAQDHPAMRVVLALDRCTDGTEAVARDAIGDDDRFEIVSIDACPDDWAGKVHAAWSGAERSTGAADAALLCFTDADCVFEPRALRAACAMLERRKLDLLSLLTRLSHGAWFERLLQPAAVFELMRQYPIERANRAGERQRPFINGQFMLFRAEAYRAMGGHEAVRGEILEDLAFGRLCKRRGLRSGVLPAGSMVRCRMYDALGAFRTGWKRIYAEGAQRRSDRLARAALRCALAGMVLPVLAIAAATWGVLMGSWVLGVVGLVGVAAWLAAWGNIHRASGAPWVSLAGCLIGPVHTALLLRAAGRELARGVPVRWGGRSYVREDRAPARRRAASPTTEGNA
mgnify:CR=1 FL=1